MLNGSDYAAFLETKRLRARPAGRHVSSEQINETLFPFQRDLVRWALRKGRAALFCDTGMGKTFMQLEWARLTGERTLILAPLAVARQTVGEARKLGIELTYARSQAAAGYLTITNYEMVEHFDPAAFGAVVCDESSILKSFEGKTRTKLIELFQATPYRLCCTATPAPNDIAEIANHAEFLGLMSRVEMLATFFVHDDAGWRLKGHAREPFYRWLASWGMSLKSPADLGYAADAFRLPPLSIRSVVVDADVPVPGKLFGGSLGGVQGRARVRQATLADRAHAAAELIRQEPGEPWLVWVGLNDEGRELTRLLPGAALVEGTQSPEEKAAKLESFVTGETRILITKPSIAGFGMNFQHCARMVFVGLSDSYEAYYQAIRRCYRFGQQRPVEAWIVLSEAEQEIHANVLRKEREAEHTARELVRHLAVFEREEIQAGNARLDYQPGQAVRLPAWLRGEVTCR
jgi:hypothetical protein